MTAEEIWEIDPETGRPPGVAYGECWCGCGGKTRVARRTRTRRNERKGEPMRFILGHNRSRFEGRPDPNPSGLCQCGCGEITPVAKRTINGAVKGKHHRFVDGGHASRLGVAPWLEDQETGCWVWQAGRCNGYGVWGAKGPAHRVTYRDAVGAIPDGYVLHHVCRNKLCVNPDHLEPMTRDAHTQLHAEEDKVAA